jgi:uncharacterized protein
MTPDFLIPSVPAPASFSETLWYQKSRSAMHQATLIESEERYGTAEPLFNYRWEHVVAVVNLSRQLVPLTGADAEIVEAAAWLHDIAKQTAGQKHPKVGAMYARHFLPETDFPAEKVEAVAYAIEQHMGLWRDEPLPNLEAAVLWDADKLAKIGLTAAFHWMGGWFAKDNTLTTPDLIRRGRKQDWLPKTVASMHTEPARRAAQKRVEQYYALWDNLEAELNGTDLLLE